MLDNLKNYDDISEDESNLLEKIRNNIIEEKIKSTDLKLKIYFNNICTISEYIKFILILKKIQFKELDRIYRKDKRNVANYTFADWRFYQEDFIKNIFDDREHLIAYHCNSWIAYFQFLQYSNPQNKYIYFYGTEEWIDLENIIKYNFDSKYLNDDLAPTYNKHMKLKEIENTEEGKKVSFQEMKKELVNYLMFKSSSINLIDFDKKVLNNYTNKVSFNYTRIFNWDDQKNEEYFHIHGNINNDENIVFGFDESELFLNSGQKLSDEGVLYTKVDQIIELNDKRVNKDINHFNERYDRLRIYGLSMGVADYSYYSNVILKNLDNIIIEIYYSDTEMCRNKKELRQSFYHLMKYIEMLAGKPLYHEMIITNRVKFIKQRI